MWKQVFYYFWNLPLILIGGYDGSLAGYDESYLNTILEYDITGDSYTEIGTMIQARDDHAVSVVKYEDFSEWCQSGCDGDQYLCWI